MVTRGPKTKYKIGISKDTPARQTSKMAAPGTSQTRTQRVPKSLSHNVKTLDTAGEIDSDYETPENVIQSNMFRQFEKMLQKALKQTSDQITEKLTREIRELGHRTAELEMRVDDIETTTQHYDATIEQLKDENSLLQNRLEDQENRDRRSNLRIRGLPESIIDLQGTICALFQELLPGISPERLEMDRVHRALTQRKPNGPPRDIIVKFHYYKTKEQILAAARGKNTLEFQGNIYQLFTDLSPLTVTKRRSMKLLLQVLQKHQIIYHWGFPFSLRFTYLETRYTCRTSDELRSALIDLGLMDHTNSKEQPRRRAASRSPPNETDLDPNPSGYTRQNLHKRGRFDSQAPINVDSMD